MASKDASRMSIDRAVLTTIVMLACLSLNGLANAQTRKASASKQRSTQQRSTPANSANSNQKKADIVAVVNHETITRSQLAKECIRRFGETVIESEINKRVILEACREKNIRITNGDIEAEVESMANKFGVSKDRWLQMLQKERQITPNQYRRDIVWPTLALRRLAADKTQLTDDELKAGYESEYGPSVQVRMIVARTQNDADRILKMARANPDEFDVLAKDKSCDENTAATRGLIPPIRKHTGDPDVNDAAFRLRPGEISPVIPTAGRFIIMKCERHFPAQELSAKDRQLAMDKVRERLEDRKLRVVSSKLFKAYQDDAGVVNVYNDPQLRKQMPGVAATVKGKKITLAELGEQCIVRHGEAVLENEITRKLLTQTLKRRSQRVTEEDLQEEIRRAAEAFGYVSPEGTVDVDRWLKKVTDDGSVTVDTYVRDAVWPTAALKKLVGANVKVTEEDLRKGFQANYGERVEVLAIVLSSQRTAHEVFDLARNNSKSEQFFGELAHQYSIEPVSRANFGQVPPIRKFGGQPLIEQEAFKLKPGEISGVLAAGDKFIILRCLGHTQPVVEDMSIVKEELERDIREKKLRVAMNREFDRLKERAQVDNFLAGTTSSGKRPEGRPVSYSHSGQEPNNQTVRTSIQQPTRR